MSPKRIRPWVHVQDRIGQRFGRLIVTAVAYRRKKKTYVHCLCECGKKTVTLIEHLQSGHTTSCGCYNAERIGSRRRTHGLSASREYRIWQGMHARCNNPELEKFHCYGGRGIRVCERWASFAAFIEDMGMPPSPKYEIERIDNSGNYEPGNCRWATRKEQMRNTRKNRLIAFRGETLPLVAWSERTGLSVSAISHRLKIGWPVELALTTPLGVCRKRGWPDGTPRQVSPDNF